MTRERTSWFITGASQGFGHALTAEALSRGSTVTATARDASSLADLASPGLTVIEADLLCADDVVRVAESIARTSVDVLVNNAGRAIVGAAEEVAMPQLREQLELNFFAAAALTRAALPGMRERKAGDIIQMSSQGGRLSFPGVGAYSASKFALEGWSEALAAEVAAFGIRVMLVEPSRFRTGFNSTHSLGLVEAIDAYAGVVGPVRADLTGIEGHQEGDPERAAAIIADLVESDALPLRLPLGAEAVERLATAYTAAGDGVRRWAEVARSADFPGGRPTTRGL
ncbi:SDR family NAD(P)-dependent oxidoreductase [Tsukamurella sp. 8F]|uniref:SDR family NAD(P)-dependent oxidoreductase n=1 Tax=unclassified Tsukamurella TaxID=2633480 RepID=UPI0023BA1427|nr:MULTISPECIES: SDR family NAD(P)-dependent oxidoreductase [unclassified Tsukamurella]MDF0528841.1 SDR family NAD(P)-dependent oxidoreductase [Tsukamurella sp. 8J]MDF0586676.1 SDR family NAD(P)-dependent oxidoreductase [Tsukamurella sp. 8F]